MIVVVLVGEMVPCFTTAGYGMRSNLNLHHLYSAGMKTFEPLVTGHQKGKPRPLHAS